MTNDELSGLFSSKVFPVRAISSGRWEHPITDCHTLEIYHEEKSQDITFKVVLMEVGDNLPGECCRRFLEFNTTLLNGAFAIDSSANLIFIDRIPSFDLDWKEFLRTVLTAKEICLNINKYLNRVEL